MNSSSPFRGMLSESSRFDFPSLKHQGCICRTWDIAITPLIPSDKGHILKLGETQQIIIPLTP